MRQHLRNRQQACCRCAWAHLQVRRARALALYHCAFRHQLLAKSQSWHSIAQLELAHLPVNGPVLLEGVTAGLLLVDLPHLSATEHRLS
jgi:hypothetical protein